MRYGKYFPDSSHRKIVLYYNYMDKEELETGGHGTHVSGIIAGKSTHSSVSQYDVLEKCSSYR